MKLNSHTILLYYTLYVHHGYGHLDYVVLIYRHGLRCTYSLLYTLLVLLRDTLPRCLTYVVVHPVPPRHYPVCLVYHFLSSVTTRRGVTDIHTLSCVALSPPAHPRSRSSIEIVLDGVVLDGVVLVISFQKIFSSLVRLVCKQHIP